MKRWVVRGGSRSEGSGPSTTLGFRLASLRMTRAGLVYARASPRFAQDDSGWLVYPRLSPRFAQDDSGGRVSLIVYI
jgi:hypothetical protein